MNFPGEIASVGNAAARPFGLSPEPRIRMWPAPADLVPYVSGVHLYVVGDNGGELNRGAFEPAFAGLRIALAGGDTWRVRFPEEAWRTPPAVSLFGPNSRLIESRSGAGVLLSGGLRPRGWRRLFADPAHAWANRIASPPDPIGAAANDALGSLRSCQCDEEVAEAYLALVRTWLGPPTADSEDIAAVEDALVNPAIHTVAALCDATGLPIHRLQRLARSAFGFGPKLLLRRARFLRSLHAIRATRRGSGAMAIDPAYTDYSHFVRDSHEFLGMSPQAFVEHDSQLLRSSLALRAQVIGAPAQALDQVGG